MFKTATTPQDLFKLTTDYFAGYPKTPEDMKVAVEKAQAAFTEETENAKEVISIFTRAASGNATMNEIQSANEKAQKALAAARFATVVAMPGGIFMLPALTKMADTLGVDFVPESVKKAFA